MKKIVTYALVVSVAIAGGVSFKDAATSSGKQQAKDSEVTSTLDVNVGSRELTRVNVVSMGSSLEILVYGDKEIAVAAIKDAVKEIHKLESLITSWKPSSEVYLINERSGEDVKVSHTTLGLVKEAIQRSKDTDGYFDISIGAIWDLYPFRDKHKVPPTDAEIESAMAFVGYDKIKVDESTFSVQVPDGVRINLGAIGKGEAVNVAMSVLEGYGIKNAAVSSGGDLTAIGKKGSEPWSVAIEDPRWEGAKKMVLAVEDASIATSGDSKRFFDYKGKRYGHILSPKTGLSVTHMQSATVVAKDPAMADSYATAIYVMGVEKGLAWAEKQNDIKALVIDSNGDVLTTSNFKNYGME